MQFLVEISKNRLSLLDILLLAIMYCLSFSISYWFLLLSIPFGIFSGYIYRKATL